MKKVITGVIAVLLLAASVSCFAIATEEAWKNNTGEINLDKMTVTGEGIEVDGNTVKITSGGDFTVTGTTENGSIYVNSEDKVKLRLSGVNITSTDGPAIFFDNAKKAFITITEDTQNVLTDSKEYSAEDADAALFSNDDLEIKGDGTLTVNGNYKHGIASDDDLSIENGNITVNSYEHAIKVNDTLSVLGGTLSLNAETGKGMKAEKEFIIDDGKINIVTKDNEGMESKGTLVINGGDINIDAAEDGINTGNPDTTADTTTDTAETADKAQIEMSQIPQRQNGRVRGEQGNGEMPPQMSEGGEMPAQRRGRGMPPEMAEGEAMPEGMTPPQRPAQMPDGENMPQFEDGMTPPEMGENGQMPMHGQRPENGFGGGFMRIDEETAAAHAITINGGNIYIKAGGDGIDSNGNLTINGGTVIINGPENSANGPLDSEGTMEINGGTVILLSASGMIQLPRNENGQNIIRVGFGETLEKGTAVSVKDKNEKVLISLTSDGSYNNLIFSSPELEAESEYKIYIDDVLKETVTVNEGLTTAGSMGGFGGRGGMGGFGGRRSNGMNNRSQIKVSVNGKNIDFDMKPVMKNDTTLVGIRAIMESLGLTVDWEEETETVTVTGKGTTIKMTIGSDTAYVNGETKKLLLAPEIIGTSTMVPVRFLSEQLGMTVDWNEENQQITISE